MIQQINIILGLLGKIATTQCLLEPFRKEEWKEEGQFFLITSLLESRFGTLDAELLELVEKIAQIPISDRTQLLLSLANLFK